MSAIGEINIRKFDPKDRSSLRRISCDTAFLDIPREGVFSDDEILADALTSAYTDYEPESCFVAEVDGQVVGYIIGSKDIKSLNRLSRRIPGQLFSKALRKGLFLRVVNLKFLFYCLLSWFKGEFSMPEFSNQYPAMLHINVEQGYRARGIGESLIKAQLKYLIDNNVHGVHFGSISDEAKEFFLKMGFKILFQSSRSYFKPYLGKDINFYILGKILTDSN